MNETNPFQGLSNQEAKALVIWALSHESFVETVAVSDLRNVLIDAARAKGAEIQVSADEVRIARPAYLKIEVDDRIVLALRNPPSASPYVFLLTAVPTQALERARSSIVVPGEAH